MPHGSTSPPMNARLYQAATRGDEDLLKRALEKLSVGNELSHMKTYKKNSVLHVAASFGHHKIVQLIVQKCSSLVTKRNLKGDTPLHNAARNGHLPVVAFLIDHANNVSSDVERGNIEEFRGGLLRTKNEDGNTALHEAIKYGHQIVAQALIEADQELLNFVNNNGESSFYLTAEAGLEELVAELLKFPIDHLLCEKHVGKTALHAAISRQRTGIILLLVKEKPELLKLRDAHERSPLHYALDLTDAYLDVRNLLKGDTSIAYHQDCDGIFPIHKAAIHGFILSIQEILQHCPDSVDLLDHRGRNILHIAVENREDDLVNYILRTPELAELINEKDVEGNTPLHLATLEGNAMFVNTLVGDKRVDLGVVNKEGLTPRDIAERMHFGTEKSLEKRLALASLLLARAPRSYGKINRKDINEHYKQTWTNTRESMKDKMNTLLVVATLIVTVTFAAGFTMPGGYNNDGPEKGMATMIKKATFHVFVISNTLAMCSSILAALTIVSSYVGETPMLRRAMEFSFVLTGISLAMITVAFGSGVNLVLNKLRWLATVVLFISFMSIVLMLPFFIFCLLPRLQKYRWISALRIRLLLLASRL